MYRRAKGGFTLVEIMIVVTIIGLLAMMAIPSLMKSRNKSQNTICKYNQKLIIEQMDVYCTDKGLALTTANFPNLCAARDALVPAAYNQRYIKSRTVFSCPSNPDRLYQHDYSYLTGAGGTITGLRCDIQGTHNTW